MRRIETLRRTGRRCQRSLVHIRFRLRQPAHHDPRNGGRRGSSVSLEV